MSAGHGHKRANLKHPKELKKLMTTGGAPELMQRWQSLDVDHDVTDLAGYNIAGTVRYLDKDFFRALLDPAYATQILGEPIDTGLPPDQTVECIAEHESDEKVILDGDNPIDGYLEAHELATVGEHERVIGFGGSPLKYERGLQRAIKFCEQKTPANPPHDLCCAPLLDNPDKNDLRVLKLLRQRGVADAFKLAKSTVEYAKATVANQCAGCKNWQNDRSADLSTCSLIEGLVRRDRWCKKFEATENQITGKTVERKP